MNREKYRYITGLVLLTQENRFRLLGPDGRSYLLTVAHNADFGVEDLKYWRAGNRQIRVKYSGEPDFESGVAHSARPDRPA